MFGPRAFYAVALVLVAGGVAAYTRDSDWSVPTTPRAMPAATPSVAQPDPRASNTAGDAGASGRPAKSMAAEAAATPGSGKSSQEAFRRVTAPVTDAAPPAEIRRPDPASAAGLLGGSEPTAAKPGRGRDVVAAVVPTPRVDPTGTATRRKPVAPDSGPKSGEAFRDCAGCPEMVRIPAGAFVMGSDTGFGVEKPRHRVSVGSFAIGRREVTFAEWELCVQDRGCAHRPNHHGWGRENRPVIDVSWHDAQEFVAWLSRKTGHRYRLPSEAEWEYAARGGTTSAFWWGEQLKPELANCAGCGAQTRPGTVAVASFSANAFGLFDMAGNAAEWVEDCWNDSYRGAPTDGSAWTKGHCAERV